MSLDVTSYWQSAALTANGLIRYEADEVALYCTQTPHIDIECGGDGAKHTFKAGHAHVTSHRIVWVRERSAHAAQSDASSSSASAASSSPATAAAVCLPLDSIERVEQKSLMLSLGFGTPKLILHLHDPNMLAFIRRKAAAAGAGGASTSASSLSAAAAASSAAAEATPTRSTLPRFVRLCFRNEAPHAFLQHLQSSLAAGVWRHSPPAPLLVGGKSVAAAAAGHEFTTAHAGISGIERVAKKRERAIDRTLEQAFQDLDALMANAKQVVDLSTRLAQQSASASANARGESGSGSDRSELQSILSDMGIANPVTRELAGSDYHMQLARQMADFLPAIMAKQGGMLLLTDVYCVVNRARGTQLISPLDCLTACQLFPRLAATTLRLKEFDSGVKAVVADARTEANIATKILAQLEQEEEEASAAAATAAQVAASPSPSPSVPPAPFYASLSPLRLSNLWHISIVLAKQYLCVAEQLQVLCRDESTHGLAFTINHFARFQQAQAA